MSRVVEMFFFINKCATNLHGFDVATLDNVDLQGYRRRHLSLLRLSSQKLIRNLSSFFLSLLSPAGVCVRASVCMNTQRGGVCTDTLLKPIIVSMIFEYSIVHTKPIF